METSKTGWESRFPSDPPEKLISILALSKTGKLTLISGTPVQKTTQAMAVAALTSPPSLGTTNPALVPPPLAPIFWTWESEFRKLQPVGMHVTACDFLFFSSM
jgi:hypothetical protein